MSWQQVVSTHPDYVSRTSGLGHGALKLHNFPLPWIDMSEFRATLLSPRVFLQF